MIPKTKLSKIFLLVVILVLLLFFLNFATQIREQRQAEKRVEELAGELEKIANDLLDKKAADTFGGRTPQETLDMFISAVEKGDYELASKYFVIEKQAEWKEDLSTATNVVELLTDIQVARLSGGEYSFDKKSYSIYEPVLVSFILYPSGNWKIEEI